MKIYVGNLPYSVNDADLRDMFAPFGNVDSAVIITDKFTGQARGFGFVEMSDDDQARAAMAALNGKEIGGRALRVNEAEAKPDRGGGGGGGRGGYGGGGGGRGGGGGYGGGGGGRGGGGGGRGGGGGYSGGGGGGGRW